MPTTQCNEEKMFCGLSPPSAVAVVATVVMMGGGTVTDATASLPASISVASCRAACLHVVRHAGRGTLSVRASSGVTRRPVNPFDPRAPPAVKGTIVWHHQTRSFLCVVHHVLSITCRSLHRQHDAPPTGPAR
ncbi:hypothetical protein E2C01_044482 [Portunus trituberculatus]|uniref:Uncharacterized protein n=1 Tax=Portunus trituberculatus TaxID=210409 RepID=A0A5B7G070_PORTR|nr:hypothetical protein [Portunus trituberculatus]